MDDMSEYTEIYAVESAEHLQSMNDALLILEKDPDNIDTINAMFRAAHTLKSMSATMGFMNISDLTHKMENLLDRVRNREIRLDSEITDLLFEGVDTLEKMVEDPEKSASIEISVLIEKIICISEKEVSEEFSAAILPGLPEIEPETKTDQEEEGPGNNIPDEKADGFKIFNVCVTLHESCLLKSARSTVVLKNISKLGDVIDTYPSLKDIEDEKFDRDFRVIVSTKEKPKQLEETVKKISEIYKVEVKQIDSKTNLKTKIKTPEKSSAVKKTTTSIKSVQSVRVSIERLDSLMNLVGELVINKIRLMQISTENNLTILEETLASLNRLTNELQEEIMEARMVPIGQIFNRFPRMVRDLAKSENKDIDLILEGGEIELDRTILDDVGDPIVHVLKNCVDHGIETPEIRKKNGKNPKGTIRLTARREKNHVIIEIADDGKGMDPKVFRKIAVEKGLITEDEAIKISDEEAINLSFLAGFSTAKKVTDVSGRGVGMDVVRSKIGSMNGSVKLESKLGEGTKLILKLPLTVAIIQSLMVKVGKDIYAIPISNVIRSLVVESSHIKTIQGEETIFIMDEVLPIIRLNKLFGTNGDNSGNLVVVVVESGGKNVGLVVNQIIAQQEVMIKNLDNKILKGVKGFAGATILGDGNVALIIDLVTLLS